MSQSLSQRGLFVDFDGTLCDSLAALRAVWRDFLLSRQVEFAEDEFDLVNGPPIPGVVARLKQRYRLAGPLDGLVAEYLDRVRQAHGAAPPVPGAEKLFRTARQRGWIVAVVTSSPHAAVAGWLARSGLDGTVDFVVGGDDVARGKPDPEPYRHALMQGNAEAARSLAVEDSAQGARSALGAGLPLWLVDPGGLTAEVGQSPLYRGLLRGLAEIDRFL